MNCFTYGKKLCEAESNYLSGQQKSRALLANFKQEQNTFDKYYPRAKRKFECDKQINIERLNTENPSEFWDAMKNLDPRKNNNIPMQVYDNEGNVTGERNAVMSKWLEVIGLNVNTDTFNAKISLEKMQKVLDNAQNNKAVGVDNLPNKV